ncbi:DNA topoisomerase IB [Novosphingobium sp. Gsoil 351]|uniref:DNA topoisomerase IB n=1 Tax=Novosphingobium sp. Gsoil 351 TaxID=2675225 RepID=UPI0012B50017|nr:DNA topoisomerase IB [Novosphingobium sp. Gsoil 351]QGN55922.1 DNA topoisomerase IB [Novosphingobium sp. Gsoil 351]
MTQTTFRAGKSRLIYCDDSLPGLTRRKAGKGWAYFDAKGRRVTDRDEIDRLNRIALPPAYVDAWFCPADNGHLLATGIDAKGRKQYRYHPDFRALQEGEKFDSAARFGRLLPLVRKRVEDDLRSPRLTRERAVASIVRLLDTGGIRVGNETYAKDNKSFGATTLRMRHADVSGSVLKLRFKAKSGKLCEMKISDKSLARFVKRMQDLPGQHLFQYLDDDGVAQPVGSAEVNDYLRETMSEDFTAKNFRTWHASAIGLQTLAEAQGALSVKALAEAVSARLGNTPAIARKSYIHPAVIALVDRQVKWRATLKLPRATRWLSPHERALIDLLEKGPSAAKLIAAA